MPTSRVRERQLCRRLDFTRQCHVPVSHLAEKSDRLHQARKRTMKLHFRPSDFAEMQDHSIKLPACSIRRGERIIAVTPLEARITRCLPMANTAEESAKGFVQALQDILKDRRSHLLIFRPFLFDVH